MRQIVKSLVDTKRFSVTERGGSNQNANRESSYTANPDKPPMVARACWSWTGRAASMAT